MPDDYMNFDDSLSPSERRRILGERIVELHKTRIGLVAERDYWTAQGFPARATAFQNLVDAIDTRIAALRTRMWA